MGMTAPFRNVIVGPLIIAADFDDAVVEAIRVLLEPMQIIEPR
jgi:hypothetical protein